MTKEARNALLTIGLLVLALVVRLINLGEASLWVDEAVSTLQSKQPFGEMIAATAKDNYPPLHNIILWGVIRVFGQGELWLRLPSALAGVGAIWMAGRVAGLLYGRRAAPIAMALLIVSSLHLHYAQEARMYALLAFFAAWSMDALIRWVRAPTFARGLIYVVATVLMTYTHYYALFIVAAQNLYVAFERFRPAPPLRPVLGNWIRMQLGVAIVFAPWAATFLERVKSVQAGFWLAPPTADFDAASAYFRHAWPIAVVLMLVAVLPRVPWLRESKQAPAGDGEEAPRDRTAATVTLTSWLFVPLLVPFVLSLVVQPFYHLRYTLGATLAAYVLAAGGLRRLRLEPKWEVLAVVVLVGLQVPALVTEYGPDRAPWRELAPIIDRGAQPGDVILVLPNMDRDTLRVYFTRAPAPPHLPGIGELEGPRGEALVRRYGGAPGAVWFVEHDARDRAGAELFRRVMLETRVRDLDQTLGALRVERFSRRAGQR